MGQKQNIQGADARHTSSDAVALKTHNAGAFTVGDEATEVSVDTQTLSLIFGFQPNENWNIYAGPVYQTVEGNVQLRGTAYGPYGGFLCTSIGTTDRCNKADSSLGKDHNYKGYKAQIKEDSSVGWLAGLASQIPEIALKASLTYRSEIDHKTNINEELPVTVSATASAFPITAAFYETNRSSKVTTPQSVNLDLQSGIMENTIAFAQLRWVDWSSFEIRPHQFNQLSKVLYASKNVPSNFALVAYDKDQISANLGVARKFNEQWAGTLMVGWDSGAGNPVSTLGPTDGYWSAGLDGQFSPTPQTFIQAGVKYFWLGDAKSQVASDFGTDKYIANFNDNHAIGYSLKMGYRF
ncbi:Outer membrane protein transport protein (OMPP1/FadL/TodX) [Acinetobacter bouvetii]|uniref:Outer membrane protein transport protein (OMPP1/FadL/TodX) n=1 Tax=Acinetobacter bouvetii TaxID=202951 RepID=A0A811GJ19_9GAMM|nr:Outer membrane protein transport protein (OMPP1/FadL/TodX) [Acinetobacter bouvetii]